MKQTKPCPECGVEIAVKNWLDLWLRCPECGTELEREYAFVPVSVLELLLDGHQLPSATLETFIREGRERSAAYVRQTQCDQEAASQYYATLSIDGKDEK